MKKLFCISALSAALVLCGFPQVHGKEKASGPKLVVGIVVDQMRWDYLYRFRGHYCDGGFMRLLEGGFSCDNTMLNYIPTVTAVGHTSIYTGSVPSVHGISANDFIIESTGEQMYCTQDDTESTVGSGSSAGEMSPRNMLVTTVTDELRLATNFRSRTVGVALKDRGAILPAGHTASAAYWFDDMTGRFITSTYYMDRLPEWLVEFNARDRAASLLAQDWDTLLPESEYVLSTEDNTIYETPSEEGADPVLPLKTSALFRKNGYSVIRATPYGNTLTLEMAEAVLENERLGQGAYADFLAVSLSSTDYVGHQYGINAIELEDTYLRLDRDLAEFFSFLDRTVGEGEWILFLTADHAGAHNTEFLKDRGIPAGGWPSDIYLEAIDSLSVACFGLEGAVRSLANYQVHIDQAAVRGAGVDMQVYKSAIKEYLEMQDGVAYVLDMENAVSAPVPAAVRERAVNGYNRERSGVLFIIMEPGWYDRASKDPAGGTTHGVWNPYDSHIPLLFYGKGIKPGRTHREVYMTDIAPTVAALLDIQMPNGCIGKPVTEVVD